MRGEGEGDNYINSQVKQATRAASIGCGVMFFISNPESRSSQAGKPILGSSDRQKRGGRGKATIAAIAKRSKQRGLLSSNVTRGDAFMSNSN